MRSLNYATLAVVLIVGIATFLVGAPPKQFQDPIPFAPAVVDDAAALVNDAPVVVADAPTVLPPVESMDAAVGDPSIDPTIDQLMKLRAAIGSPLSGTLLDGDDDDEFKRFLRDAIAAAPKAELLPSGEITALREPNNLPGPDSTGDTQAVAVSSLQSAAAALDLHAQTLDADLPARAARLRALAQQIRQQAAEIRELGL